MPVHDHLPSLPPRAKRPPPKPPPVEVGRICFHKRSTSKPRQFVVAPPPSKKIFLQPPRKSPDLGGWSFSGSSLLRIGFAMTSLYLLPLWIVGGCMKLGTAVLKAKVELEASSNSRIGFGSIMA